MDTKDRIIADLMDALDLIRIEAGKDTASRYYIAGVCAGAMDRCNDQRERNADGYLVAKVDARTRARAGRPAWIDSEEFDGLLYAYRSAPTSDQAWVNRAFEAVLAYIATQLEPVGRWRS